MVQKGKAGPATIEGILHSRIIEVIGIFVLRKDIIAVLSDTAVGPLEAIDIGINTDMLV